MPNIAAQHPNPLRPVTCAVCGVHFLMPREMHWAATANGKPIYCPAGHAWTPLPPQSDPNLNLVQALLEARAELVDCRLQLAEARAAVVSTPAAIGVAELRRRSRLAANHARTRAGQAECRYCGRMFAPKPLAEHMRRRHAAQLAALDVDRLILDGDCE
jgi:hypothetical protein